MSLILGSNYRELCANFLEMALCRPQMYFRTLGELEAIMRGHAAAFEQLGLIDREESFHSCFGDWVYSTTTVSPASGWAHAIESLASIERADPFELFSELVRSFLAQWDHEKGGASAM